jgi:BolA family transcriptional regulator, general stress-responsive regulator
MSTITRMRERLAVLAPTRIEIVDDSAKHAGHAGARDGGGHYNLVIESARFAGQSTLARHRLVYTALADLMQRDIHALAIDARVPAGSDHVS